MARPAAREHRAVARRAAGEAVPFHHARAEAPDGLAMAHRVPDFSTRWGRSAQARLCQGCQVRRLAARECAFSSCTVGVGVTRSCGQDVAYDLLLVVDWPV